MSNTPNMNLQLPVPTTTIGPDWAEQLNTALETVDEHDHSAGKGIPVPASGLNIDNNLSMNSHKLTEVEAVSLDSQPASLPGATNVRTVYSINGDLWYNNDSGTPVQVTSGTSVATPSSPVLPAGVVLPWAGVSAPSGYLLCDGSAVSRTTFSTLFANIGTTYGVGDGSTTFNLPNMLGRTPVGAGTYTDPVLGSTTRTLGTSAGAASHTLSVSEMPSHNHGGATGSHVHQMFTPSATGTQRLPAEGGDSVEVISNQGGDFSYTMSGRIGGATPTAGQTNSATSSISAQGGGSSHNNMQPYLVLNYIIKSS